MQTQTQKQERSVNTKKVRYTARGHSGDAKHIVTATFRAPCREHWNVQYSARRHLWDAKHNVTVTFMIPIAEHRNVQYSARNNSRSLKFACRCSFVRWTHRILREGSSSKMKICVSLQRRAIKNLEMYVSLQRRAQKIYETSHWRLRQLVAYKKSQLTTVLNIRPARNGEKVARSWNFAFPHSFRRPTYTSSARQAYEFAFRHSFGRQTLTFCLKGCSATLKIRVWPQFWRSDVTFCVKGCSASLRIFVSPQFWTSGVHFLR